MYTAERHTFRSIRAKPFFTKHTFDVVAQQFLRRHTMTHQVKAIKVVIAAAQLITQAGYLTRRASEQHYKACIKVGFHLSESGAYTALHVF